MKLLKVTHCLQSGYYNFQIYFPYERGIKAEVKTLFCLPIQYLHAVPKHP